MTTESQHPETRQRLVDTFRIPADLAAASATIEDGGRTLRVEWSGDGHISLFSAQFLAALRSNPDEGVPSTPEATRAVATRIAYIRETIFGGYWDFTANMEHKDTAYTSMAIGPHTDGT